MTAALTTWKSTNRCFRDTGYSFQGAKVGRIYHFNGTTWSRLAVPAVLVDRTLRVEGLQRVKIKAFAETRIQESRTVTEMIGVRHRRHTRATVREDLQEEPMGMIVFGLKLLQERPVVLAQRFVSSKGLGNVVEHPRDVKDHSLAAQRSVHHRLPIAGEALVAHPLGPDVRHPLCLLLVTDEFLLVVGIAEVLHLQTLVFVKRGQQETELVLKIVEVGRLTVGQVWCLEDEAFRHVSAAPQMIEHNQVANKEAVGCGLEHSISSAGHFRAIGRREGFGMVAGLFHGRFHKPLERGLFIDELLDRTCLPVVQADEGFADVAKRPFHVRPGS